MKLLMWLALLGLVVAALYVKKSTASKAAVPHGNRRSDSDGAENMLRCVYCGVYLPSSEAVHDSGSAYCCEEHCGKLSQP